MPSSTIFYCLIFTILCFNSIGQKSEYASIQELIQHQNYELALEQLNKFEVDSSASSEVVVMKAKCYFQLGQWHESKLLLEAIIEKHPEQIEALGYLARIYDQESNWPKAIKYNLALLKTDTANSQYLKRIGLLHIKVAESQLAIDYLSRAMRARSNDIVITKELAQLYLAIDSITVADSLVQMGLETNPDHVSLNMVAAQIQYKLKAYDKTVDYLEFVMKKIDMNEYYVKMLGYSYLRIDSVDKAIHQLENIIHSKEGEHIHYYLALAYEKKENMEQALFHYDHAINKSISPRIDIYCTNASTIQYEQKNTSDAIEYLKLAHRFSDKDIYLFKLAQMSDLYYRDKSIAIRYYNRYAKSGSNNLKNKTYAQQRAQYLKELAHQEQ